VKWAVYDFVGFRAGIRESAPAQLLEFREVFSARKDTPGGEMRDKISYLAGTEVWGVVHVVQQDVRRGVTRISRHGVWSKVGVTLESRMRGSVESPVWYSMWERVVR
jgi:hypothetical protein